MKSIAHTVYIGNKFILIESSSDGTNSISKNYKNLLIKVDLDDYLSVWMAERLREAVSSEGKLGFLGQYYSNDQKFSLHINQKKGGTFMGMLVKSRKFTARRKYLCIPRGSNGRGWEDVAKGLEQIGKNKRPRLQCNSTLSRVLATPEVSLVGEEDRNVDHIHELRTK